MSTPHTPLPTAEDVQAMANALTRGLWHDDAAREAGIDPRLVEGDYNGDYIVASSYLVEHHLDGRTGQHRYEVVELDTGGER